MPEEFLAWLRWPPTDTEPPGNIRGNPGLRTDLAALANAQMSRHGRLATNLSEILQARRANDADLRRDYAAASESNVMTICTRLPMRVPAPMMVSRVDPRSIVELAPNFHVVFHNHTTKLRDTERAQRW